MKCNQLVNRSIRSDQSRRLSGDFRILEDIFYSRYLSADEDGDLHFDGNRSDKFLGQLAWN